MEIDIGKCHKEVNKGYAHRTNLKVASDLRVGKAGGREM